MSNQILRQRSISETISHSFQFYATFFKIIFTILFTTAIPFMILNSLIIFFANVMIESPTQSERDLILLFLAVNFIIYLGIYIGFIAEFLDAYRVNPETLSFRELIFKIKQNLVKHIVTMIFVIVIVFPYGLDLETTFQSESFVYFAIRFLLVLMLLGTVHMVIAHQRKSLISGFSESIRLNMKNLSRALIISLILIALFSIIIYVMAMILFQLFSLPEMQFQQIQVFDIAAIGLVIFYSFFIVSILPVFSLGFFFHYYDIYDRSNESSLLDKIDEM